FGMWTRWPQMKTLFRTIERVAESDVTVLIRGESGTGKEHVARAIHGLSPRRSKPFVAINCATLSPTLAESELFGHVKGAFTGAVRDHAGYFDQADGGTIFLDEVAEIPLDLQGKLLRVLQDHTFVPVGGTRPHQVNVRVLSATHRSLRQAVAEQRFRDDLMYRLRVVPLFLPALRERRGDIELLVAHFIGQLAGLPGRHRFRRVSADAMRALLDYGWPGNVRELQNALEYASVVGTDEVLARQDLPPEFRDDDHLAEARGGAAVSQRPSGPSPAGASPLHGQSQAEEGERIRQALDDAHGNKGKAAELLGMHRTTLWRKLREHGLR
ncbi:MAG: sigma-54 interaction domain-containing protein, partial [Planctomycetota bacterium]